MVKVTQVKPATFSKKDFTPAAVGSMSTLNHNQHGLFRLPNQPGFVPYRYDAQCVHRLRNNAKVWHESL